MPTVNVPDYAGGSIVNLAAEVEARMGGNPQSPPLHADIGGLIPEAAGYIVVLFDGLGAGQLAHADAGPLVPSRIADLDGPFPATTTVALASIATGLPPRRHGLLGYQMWMPELDVVVNTIKWTTLWGAPVEYPTGSLLPQPNLWERLEQQGCAAYTVQPAGFDRSPLSLALYRGCRFVPAPTGSDLVAATLETAGPGRVVLTYVPHVDFAAHVHGQGSPEYARALRTAAEVWSGIAAGLPGDVALVGTADHGHIDFPPSHQHKIAKQLHEGRVFFGDGRAMFVKGEGRSLAEVLPATWVPPGEAAAWWGPGPAHPEFAARAPDGILLADDDTLLLHRFSDDRMIGNHGAMVAAEQRVPLFVAP